MFLSDLVRHMDGDVSLDFMAVSSYAKGTTSSGEVRLLKDLDTTLDSKDVLIVEDIVDTGLTLTYLQDILRARGPNALRTACLLSKPSRRRSMSRSNTSGSPSRIASSSATVSTTPSGIATSRTSACSDDLSGLIRVPIAPLSSDLFRKGPGIGDDLGAVQRPHLPVPHQDLPVHDRRPDVVSARDVDEM